MVLEFAILIIFDVAVADPQGHPTRCRSASFAPHNVFSGSIGIGLMFAFTSFVGFESGALYGEETANPERSVPTRHLHRRRAASASSTSSPPGSRSAAIGVNRDPRVAAGARPDNLGNLLFNQATTYAGDAASRT